MWDACAGDKHTLLLADGDCIQPIIYYSGQQVALEEEQQQEEDEYAQEAEEEEEEKLKTGRERRGAGTKGGGVGVRGVGGGARRGGGGSYTQQPVLLPFCMNVSSSSSSSTRCSPAWRNLVVQQQLHCTSLFLLFFLLPTLFLAAPLHQQCVCGRWPVCGTV